MLNLFEAGQRYLNTLPNQKKLANFIPDYHIIRLVKFSSKAMPAFACFAIVWQYLFSDPTQSILANAVITAIFAISIPFQGLYWLGKRAKSPLSLSLLAWYESLRQKLITAHVKLEEEQALPSFQDFANLLKLAEETWGNAYFDEL
ncbi:membrane protein [Mannheimia granulomatis]|uniref:UPF0208 membrane protein YfbV n=1 Tax=Mannheimia granulomatis TaxID=85402 RepID=A0A011NAW1_9PAST|nr:terminus macrodomain insulation protein YfbV [Mannheimia granulomatis]EXI61480.1 membrane protein [Mannheimia granulomatis]RGE48403.1 membrane protein [Mannheimia granulomatis]